MEEGHAMEGGGTQWRRGMRWRGVLVDRGCWWWWWWWREGTHQAGQCQRHGHRDAGGGVEHHVALHRVAGGRRQRQQQGHHRGQHLGKASGGGGRSATNTARNLIDSSGQSSPAGTRWGQAARATGHSRCPPPGLREALARYTGGTHGSHSAAAQYLGRGCEVGEGEASLGDVVVQHGRREREVPGLRRGGAYTANTVASRLTRVWDKRGRVVAVVRAGRGASSGGRACRRRTLQACKGAGARGQGWGGGGDVGPPPSHPGRNPVVRGDGCKGWRCKGVRARARSYRRVHEVQNGAVAVHEALQAVAGHSRSQSTPPHRATAARRWHCDVCTAAHNQEYRVCVCANKRGPDGGEGGGPREPHHVHRGMHPADPIDTHAHTRTRTHTPRTLPHRKQQALRGDRVQAGARRGRERGRVPHLSSISFSSALESRNCGTHGPEHSTRRVAQGDRTTTRASNTCRRKPHAVGSTHK
jgi:hypothetical protein